MDRQLNQWDLVIKVKHGDTLRRIGAYVHGQLMDHNISKLRAKIISLFKFSSDAEFILTYTDEDGDVVTLDDDEELRDAVIGQHLNPLRITVHLKSNDSSDASSESLPRANSGQSETLSAAGPVMGALTNLVNVVQKAVPTSPAFALKVDEVMKSDPFKSTMTNLSRDVKNAASFSPALAQVVVELISNLGLSAHNVPIGESSGETNGASAHHTNLNAADKPNTSNRSIPETTESASKTIGSVSPIPKQQILPSVDLNADAPKDATAPLYPLEDLLASTWTANESLEHEKEKEVANPKLVGKSVAAPAMTPPPANQSPYNSGSFWAQQCPAIMDGYTDTISYGGSNKQFPNMVEVSSPAQTGFNGQFEGQIHKQTGQVSSDVSSMLGQVMMAHPYRRLHMFNGHTPRTFHRGVQCDGCGMHPIVGPRFKSNVKEDYDLCNICFTQMGNETEYTRIDHSPHRAHRMLKDFHNQRLRVHNPISNVFHGSGGRQSRVKLESRFIQDVTVMDGTIMPPSTRFTKIWRLRNNGSHAWPFGTQLVWVGGDQFGDRISADLEIPESGFPVDKELDVAVDFTAPSTPGRYVSYWRMTSPLGQKFGQRVWVLIQVDCLRPNSAAGSSFYPDLNLNLPPESSGRNGSVIIDVNAEPSASGFYETSIIDSTEESVGPEVDNAPDDPKGQPAQVAGAKRDADAPSSPKGSVPPSASYPLIDLQAPLSVIDAAPAVDAVDGNSVEQTLLKELEEMGFKQIDLNKEVLRINEYDLEQSVDDLCGFAEWDPLLSELQEMGFNDKELNKKLLVKNGGSIKRAVLDLLGGKMPE